MLKYSLWDEYSYNIHSRMNIQLQKREEYTILYIKYIWGDKMYFAIIGDIIKSRTSSNRYELQISLNQVLMELNEQYKNDMISDFTITLGDEFQGVLKNPRFLLRMLDMIELELYPTEFRFGIGIGRHYDRDQSKVIYRCGWTSIL